MNSRFRTVVCELTCSLMLAGSANSVHAADEKPVQAERAKTSFTLDEAMQQLRLYPKDPYLQYVALQLARRENRVDEIAGAVDHIVGGGPGANPALAVGPTLTSSSIFTAAGRAGIFAAWTTMRTGSGVVSRMGQNESRIWSSEQ